MTAIQTVDRINFGTARLYQLVPGGYPFPVANLTDAEVDFKADLKEAYGEQAYPIAVADGHRSIDVTAKHYTINPTILAQSLGGIITGSTSAPMALDEIHTAVGSSATLTNGATLVPNTLVVLAQPLVGGIPNPTLYAIVTAGSEVAGKSCSVNGTGVITFAAGDATVAFSATYQYTLTVGTRVSVANPFQNSSLTFQLVMVKRDLSPVDNATAELVMTLFAVRSAGIKNPYKEGDFTVYERSYKAYANGAGNVFQADFVNF